MSKLALVLRELHRGESALARDLYTVADRHRADHEIFHVGRDIAGWSALHVRRLAEVGERFDVRLPAEPRLHTSAPAQRDSTGLRLLADLRRVHRRAAGVSLDWEILAQAAQAMKERPLLDLAQACHPQVLRQMRWANAHLKVVSPQIIASGPAS